MTELTVYFDFRAISTWTKPIVGTTSPSMTAVRLGSIRFSVYNFLVLQHY